jgi:PE family protein
MTFLGVDPMEMGVASGVLGSIAASFAGANGAAAAPTTGVLPANAVDTSALMAAAFSTHGGLYQAVAAEAAAMKELLASMVGVSGTSYAATEGFNAVAML